MSLFPEQNMFYDLLREDFPDTMSTEVLYKTIQNKNGKTSFDTLQFMDEIPKDLFVNLGFVIVCR